MLIRMAVAAAAAMIANATVKLIASLAVRLTSVSSA
jgi:hypothetical protein